MASIIEGYSYDVFISYRQKDNKHDGWVTDFVDNLKGELESAFKEEITVYFDVNPHDGLLGTHDVNASLEEKLRCLIFIPIISRTYCDPKSFAWEHEFKAFLESARHDRFGLKVKLTGGNVASRILPVQIHDLDPDDRQTLEKELGGLMRGIEFIYKEPGVNRPLRANEDTPHENLNHTTYRNQINKVANSIKELITAIKGFEPSNNSGSPADPAKAKTIEPVEKPRLKPKRRTSKILALAAVVIFAGIIMIFGGRLFRKGNLERDNNGKLSIAVVNFQNNTNDTTLNWLENGIPELLRSNLASGNNELSIQNSQVMDEISESMSQEGKTGFSSSFSRDIARKLKASAYITGSYQKYGDNLLTLARLIDTNTDEVLWAGKTLGDFRTINTLTDSLSVQLKNFLELKALIRMTGPEYGQTLTTSPEACRAYIRGRQYLVNQEWENGLRQFLTALEIDSNFVMASFFVANAYDAMAAFNNEVGIEIKLRKLSAEWIKKTYKNKEKLPEDYRLWLEMWYAYYVTKNSQDVVRFCNMIGNSDIQSRYLLRDIADTYLIFEKPREALGVFEKISEINESWGEEWRHKAYYFQYSRCCFILGLNDRGKRILQKGLKIFPDDPELLLSKAMYGGFIKDTTVVNKTLATVAEERSWTALDMNQTKAYIYNETGNPDLAEKYLRKTKQISGNQDYHSFRLAAFLVETDRDVDGGMRTIIDLWEKNPGLWNNDGGYYTALGFLKQKKLVSADSVIRILADSIPTASIRLDKLKKALKDSNYISK